MKCFGVPGFLLLPLLEATWELSLKLGECFGVLLRLALRAELVACLYGVEGAVAARSEVSHAASFARCIFRARESSAPVSGQKKKGPAPVKGADPARSGVTDLDEAHVARKRLTTKRRLPGRFHLCSRVACAAFAQWCDQKRQVRAAANEVEQRDQLSLNVSKRQAASLAGTDNRLHRVALARVSLHRATRLTEHGPVTHAKRAVGRCILGGEEGGVGAPGVAGVTAHGLTCGPGSVKASGVAAEDKDLVFRE